MPEQAPVTPDVTPVSKNVNRAPPPEDLAGVSEPGSVTEPNEAEHAARLQGWVPKEEFRGSDDDWVDAGTFVQRGKEINPILRANNQRLQAQVDSSQEQIAELQEQLAAVADQQAQGIETSVSSAIENLERQQFEAVGDQDFDTYQEIAARIRELSASLPQHVSEEPAEVPLSGDLVEWLADKPWFEQDALKTELCQRTATELRQTYPNLLGKAYLHELERQLQLKYPTDFGNGGAAPRQPTHSLVDSGAPQATFTSPRSMGVQDLPDDAREAMKKFVQAGQGNEDQYVALYFSQG